MRWTLALGLIGGFSLPASAVEPKDRIEKVYEEVRAASAAAKTQAELTEQLTAELGALIDYEAFSARTLKTTWPTLNKAERTQFIESFKRLVIRTYAKKFQPQSTFTIEFRGAPVYTDAQKNDVTVKTTVHGKSIAADVDYQLLLSGTPVAWRAYDIVIDDVSMALNWRRQFEKIVAKDGFKTLIERIDRKASNGN